MAIFKAYFEQENDGQSGGPPAIVTVQQRPSGPRLYALERVESMGWY